MDNYKKSILNVNYIEGMDREKYCTKFYYLSDDFKYKEFLSSVSDDFINDEIYNQNYGVENN